MKRLTLGILYLITSAIVGCNYQIINLVLMNNPLLFIGFSYLTASLILLTPIYSRTEEIIWPKKKGENRFLLENFKLACVNYGWSLILSTILNVIWLSITFCYLIKYGAFLALLVAAFSRLFIPIFSSFVFGDSVQNKFLYWVGIIVSLLGLFAYQLGGGDQQYNKPDWFLYCMMSLLSVLSVVVPIIIVRFTTSNPTENNSIPIVKIFWGIRHRKDFYMPVKVQRFIVNIASSILLIVIGLLLSTPNNKEWTGVITGVLWISVNLTIHTISLEVVNEIKNNMYVTAVDGFRTLLSYFLFPLVGVALINKPYELNTKAGIIGDFTIPYLSLFGILICCIGAFLSLLGKPKVKATR